MNTPKRENRQNTKDNNKCIAIKWQNPAKQLKVKRKLSITQQKSNDWTARVQQNNNMQNRLNG